MPVSLFVTCLVDQLFPEVGESALRVLRKAGLEVSFDPRQTCCGQPAFNSGHADEARRVGLSFLRTYAAAETVVVPSGSCTAMIRNFLPQLFDPDSAERLDARSLGERTYELSEYLVRVLKIEDLGARFDYPVVYHDSCHALRELGIQSEPRRLLRNVRGLRLREVDDGARCCGFGGTFSVKFPEVSCAIGQDKLRAFDRSGAPFVVSADASCLMHLSGLLRRSGSALRCLHLAQVLAHDG